MPIKAMLIFNSFNVCFVASFTKESAFSFPSISVWCYERRGLANEYASTYRTEAKR